MNITNISVKQNSIYIYSKDGSYGKLCLLNCPLQIEPNPDVSVCNQVAVNLASGSSILSGNPPYTYSWSPTIGLTNSQSIDTKVLVNASTTYVLTITDSLGQIVRDSIEVKVGNNPIDSIQITGSAFYCYKDTTSIHLEAVNTQTKHDWFYKSNNDNFYIANDTNKLELLKPGILDYSNKFCMSSIAISGCSVEKCININSYQFNKYQISFSFWGDPIGDSMPLCLSQIRKIMPNKILSTEKIKWYRNNVIIDTINNNISISSVGTYVMEIYNSTCSYLDTLVVYEPNYALASSSVIVCNGDSITLYAIHDENSQAIINGYRKSDSLKIKAMLSGSNTSIENASYSVSFTDRNSCVTNLTSQYSIRKGIVPFITQSKSVLCQGDSVTLNASGALNYSWSNGVQNGVPFAIYASTTFFLHSIDSNSCSVNTSKYLLVHPLPQVSIQSSATEICLQDSILLQGQGAINYTWTNGVQNGIKFPPLSSSTYTVTGKDANQCANTSTVHIIVNPLPQVSILSTGTDLCIHDSVALNAQGALTYSWANGVQDGVKFAPMSTSTYTVIGTDANQCKNNSTVQVIVHPLPQVSILATDTTICLHDSVSLSGLGAANYTWSGEVQNDIQFSPSATSTYTVIGTDTNLCTNSSTIKVDVLPIPQVSIQASNTEICIHDSIILQGQGAINYIWSNNIQDGSKFPPLSSSTYTVIGTDANQCSNTSTIQITVHDLPLFNLSVSDSVICLHDSVFLQASGALFYAWPNGLENNVWISPTKTEVYSVKGTDEYGCSMSDSAEVVVHDNPIIHDIFFDQANTLSIDSGFSQYNWYYKNQLLESGNNSSLSFQGNGMYAVEVINEFGCKAISNLKDLFINPGIEIYPTPFNDKINVYIGSDELEVLSIDLFDQHGKVIYTNSKMEALSKGINTISISGLDYLSKGVYFLRVILSIDNYTYKLIKN